jgi:hypothetical protein
VGPRVRLTPAEYSFEYGEVSGFGITMLTPGTDRQHERQRGRGGVAVLFKPLEELRQRVGRARQIRRRGIGIDRRPCVEPPHVAAFPALVVDPARLFVRAIT